jgi:hypothetical protein
MDAIIPGIRWDKKVTLVVFGIHWPQVDPEQRVKRMTVDLFCGQSFGSHVYVSPQTTLFGRAQVQADGCNR